MSSLLAALRAEPGAAAAGAPIVIGIVVDRADPERLGRVRLRYPTLPGGDASAWADVVAPGAGDGRGWSFVPELGDEVVVGFEHGARDRPVVLAALWNGVGGPPEAEAARVSRRILRSRAGHQIVLDDELACVVLEDGHGRARVTLTADAVVIEALEGDLELAAADSLTLRAGRLELVADDAITLAGETVELALTGEGVIAARTITVGGTRVDLNP